MNLFLFRWRIFLTEMQQMPDNVNKIVHAACVLHNLMIEERPQAYLTVTAEQPAVQPQGPDYRWQDQDVLDGLAANAGNTSYHAASLQRDHLRQYYSGVAAVEWQDRMITTNNNRQNW